MSHIASASCTASLRFKRNRLRTRSRAAYWLPGRLVAIFFAFILCTYLKILLAGWRPRSTAPFSSSTLPRVYRRCDSAAEDTDPLARVRHVADPDPVLPARLAAQIEHDQRSLVEPGDVEVAGHLIQGVGLGLGVAAELDLDGVPRTAPVDHQVQRAAAEAVLALDPPASIHHPLEKRHQHEVRACLAIAEALGSQVSVAAPEVLKPAQQLVDIEAAVAADVPGGLLRQLE